LENLVKLRTLILLFAFAPPLFAEITLPHLLSNDAVLQRDRPILIWGHAGEDETITVRFLDQSVRTTADTAGAWRVTLKPMHAGGPYELSVAGSRSSTVTRTDLLIGDVWVASGQSNMEFPLRGMAVTPNSYDYDAIFRAKRPGIHLLYEARSASPARLDDANSDWMPCTPATVEPISAVAYYFAIALQAKEGVPIGIISTSWGGTPAIAWVSVEGIKANHFDWAEQDASRAKAEADQAAQGQAAAREEGQTAPVNFDPSQAPSWLFNGMIAPFTQTAIKGVIWYQGERDARVRPRDYRQIFPALITSWREAWGEGDFPFLFVQLPSWEGGLGWGWIRDAQRRTLSLPNTAMAATLDIGVDKLLHPPDKKDVGERLALAARETVYGEPIEGEPPLFVRATIDGNSIRAYFAHADGLTSHNTAINDFEVAGEDGDFFPATARIESSGSESTIVASSRQVASPRFIRYGWSAWVSTYLWNSAGLSMAAFSSGP
jgi:sialate O-acetylesterase